MPKIYYFSDLHIDYNNKYDFFQKEIEPDSYLTIAGDYCGYHYPEIFTEYFLKFTDKFKRIIYITGNHEYYKEYLDDEPIKQLIDKINNQSGKNNIYFLQNEKITFEDDKLIFYGTTLWTASSGNVNIDRYVAHSINDYNFIYVKTKYGKFKITRPELINLHQDMKNKLLEFLDQIPDQEKQDYRKIIVTHHLPIKELTHPKYINDPINTGFCSDLLPELMSKDFDYWICGHTHSSNKMEFTLNNGKIARFLINPKGYDNENPNFNEYEYFEI